MCFPCRFLFLWIFFLPFFYFPVSFCVFFEKWPKKRENSRHCVTKYLFALVLLRHYAKELFAPDERFIYTTMRKKYLHSQHSLDIFWLGGAERGSLFLVTLLFLHRNKKVKGPFAINFNRRAFALLYSSLSSSQYFFEPFTSSWTSSKERSFRSSSSSSSSFSP